MISPVITYCDTANSMLIRMFSFVRLIEDPVFCTPVEDVKTGMIGFRLKQGDRRKIFWTKLKDSKKSSWVDVLRTPQGRRWVANGNADLWYLKSPENGPRYTEDLMRC